MKHPNGGNICYHNKGGSPDQAGLLSKEEERDTDAGDQCTHDGFPCNLLVEQPVGGQNDNDGGECHQGRGNACLSILYRHQREANPYKGAEDGGCSRHSHPFSVVKRFAERRQALTEIQQDAEADNAGYTAKEVGTERNDPGGCGTHVVMVHTYFTKHEADTLAEGCGNSEEHTVEGQFQ